MTASLCILQFIVQYAPKAVHQGCAITVLTKRTVVMMLVQLVVLVKGKVPALFVFFLQKDDLLVFPVGLKI